MAADAIRRSAVLLRRELQEYRSSLVLTPLFMALALALVMLLAVLLADRITVVSDAIVTVSHGDYAAAGPGNSGQAGSGDRLNPLLNLVHMGFLSVLLLVSVNYLLGCLYQDRRDRSILFWKSMPVSDREEVLARMGVALLVAPAIYIAASVLAQWVGTLLAMALVWRMDREPVALIVDNIAFGSLLYGQLSGWLLTALWLAPAYAWLLLASAVASRSPFMTAVGPVLALVLVERLVFGTGYVSAAIARHLPHSNEEGAVGFYLYGPHWALQDFTGLVPGLGLAALFIAGAVYLRRYRLDT